MSVSDSRKTPLSRDEAALALRQSRRGSEFENQDEGDAAAEQPYASIAIGPMSIDALDVPQLTRRLIAVAPWARKTHHVITANAQFYNLAEQREDFQACIASAEYVCADGISVVMACKLLAKAQVARVPGVDLVEQLCEQSVVENLPVYFLGGKEGSAQSAAMILARKYPGFKLAGSFCPAFGFEKDEELLRVVLEDIRRIGPAILFVALGAPRQEFFINDHIRPLNVPVAIGVGGSFEMIAGYVHRAPQWIQQAGMEWAYRWVQEPRRLARRYLLGNVQFMYYVLLYFFRGQVYQEGKA
jgi:N-acetylglucosaminyldiphosphoundecaprenol N-acetyl-beta-D-mannosaminyltransferase